MNILPADRFSDEISRDALCAAFSNCPIPVAPTRLAFGATMRRRGLDRAVSRVATIDGRATAFWLVAHREASAFLIASGTVPEHRGKGLGRASGTALIDDLGSRGAKSFRTEVLVGNDGGVPSLPRSQDAGGRHVVVPRLCRAPRPRLSWSRPGRGRRRVRRRRRCVFERSDRRREHDSAGRDVGTGRRAVRRSRPSIHPSGIRAPLVGGPGANTRSARAWQCSYSADTRRGR